MKVSRSKGFSLLEVLVAFVILATVVTVLMQVFGGGLRNLKVADEYAVAVNLAESEIARVGRIEPFSPGITTGEWQDFRWETRIVETGLSPTDDDSGPVIYLVAVTVRWGDEGGARAGRSFSLETLRAQARGVAET